MFVSRLCRKQGCYWLYLKTHNKRLGSGHIVPVAATDVHTVLRQTQSRLYSRSTYQMEEGEEALSKVDPMEQLEMKRLARDYNSRRAAYRREVSLLRKEYKKQAEQQEAEDKAAEEEEQRRITRERLERQRLKNIRSGQNALMEEEKRQKRAQEFQEYLDVKQRERDEKKARFTKARQMVVDELEAEAHLWLTTPEEVDAAFDSAENEQKLWGRPTGLLGAPSPSVDSHFWQFESHTFHMDKTYKLQREVLLNELLEQTYEQSIVDENYWSSERLEEREALETKAKLRAMVRAEGRRSLLRKQKEMLENQFGTAEHEIPKYMPAPNPMVLNDTDAQEREGAEILLRDPTKFFVFSDNAEPSVAGNDGGDSTYAGRSLGAPIGLRDSLREGGEKDVFPMGIGKLPGEDKRTQKEKKAQEREQKLWEAAQAEQMNEEDEIEMAAQDDSFSSTDPIDYDNNDWDSDDEEWTKGLDPEFDADILNTPPEERYSKDDIAWVVKQMERKMDYLKYQMEVEIENARQSLLRKSDSVSETSSEEDVFVNNLLMTLTNEQVLAILHVTDTVEEGMSDEELSKVFSEVPGLSEEEVRKVLQFDTNGAASKDEND